MSKLKLLAVPYLLLCATTVFGQTSLTGAAGNYISSTYSAGSITAGGVKYNVTIEITYPLSSPASSFVSQTQLTSDLSSYFTAYPNPQDPAEAILASIASSLLHKYSQLNTISLGATSYGVDPVTKASTIAAISVNASNEGSSATPNIRIGVPKPR